MKTGDRVTVTNLDGEQADGEIVSISATSVSEWEIDFLRFNPDATLWDYWGQETDPDAPVVQVDLGSGVYDYPADRVEVVDDAE